jgi:hypothetical protein
MRLHSCSLLIETVKHSIDILRQPIPAFCCNLIWNAIEGFRYAACDTSERITVAAEGHGCTDKTKDEDAGTDTPDDPPAEEDPDEDGKLKRRRKTEDKAMSYSAVAAMTSLIKKPNLIQLLKKYYVKSKLHQ